MSDQTSDAGGAENSNGSTESSAELVAARAEIEKWKNDYLYLKADFDNYRKNAIRERSDLTKFGAERLLVDILAILDNFDFALQGNLNSANIQTFQQGVQMIATELRSMVHKHGAQEIVTEIFDPTFFEAISSEETTNAAPGSILKTYRKAYKLHDKLLRPGQVVIAAEPKATTSSESESE